MLLQAEQEAEAAAAAEAAEAAGAASTAGSDGPSSATRGCSDSDDESASEASDASSQEHSDWAAAELESQAESGAGASQMDARPGSIASTYWRPERSDRKALLSTVDERCVTIKTPASFHGTCDLRRYAARRQACTVERLLDLHLSNFSQRAAAGSSTWHASSMLSNSAYAQFASDKVHPGLQVRAPGSGL